MSLLPVKGNVVYNGVTFPVETQTLGIDGKAHYDPAGRTVTYMEWTVTLKSVWAAAPGDTIDATMTTLRRTLMTPGGQFIYNAKGFGSLVVNAPLRVPQQDPADVAWGPKPQEFKWRPLGANLAAEVTWSVTVCVPECTTAAYLGKIAAGTYSVTFAVDPQGYTTRTVSGTLEIPMTRRTVEDRSLPDTADSYFELVEPSIPTG